MINESTYRAAYIVAAKVEQVLLEHLTEAQRANADDLASIPKASVIESIIDIAFWASLRKEEGHSPKISLAYLTPSQSAQPMIFAQKIPLEPTLLAKIAPGFERAGIHLGVWNDDNGIYIWGATPTIPNYCFVLDVSEPGLVVIKHRKANDFGKYSNIAILTGDEVKIVDDLNTDMNDCPALIKNMFDFNPKEDKKSSLNVMLQLAVSIRAHKRGGTLLVVPTHDSNWRNSIRHPLHYSIHPAFTGLSFLVNQEVSEEDIAAWQLALNREIDLIAGLTAIDGAIIMNDEYDLIAFGEKIKRPEGNSMVEYVYLTEPIYSGEAKIINPAHSGGTRHLSAAQFVHDQRNSLALVASQDGRFTVFSWSNKRQMVQAHRIDSLLL
ncbi:MAG: hypothetical protein SFY32_10690 [Bacteroidota bacterium]|nr:hypothetical protein [Bacteroidota bacterium]